MGTYERENKKETLREFINRLQKIGNEKGCMDVTIAFFDYQEMKAHTNINIRLEDNKKAVFKGLIIC